MIDLETTGTSPSANRVIEVGLVLCEGGRKEREWSTLVNPHSAVSEFIADYTGISNEMLTDAPTFAEVAVELRTLLLDRILIAHNARFDYGFLQQEYARCGEDFESPVLCTVRLSRKLFPKQRRHSLDAVMARHGLDCSARHRALGDALVLVDFLHQLQQTISTPDLNRAVEAQINPSSA